MSVFDSLADLFEKMAEDVEKSAITSPAYVPPAPKPAPKLASAQSDRLARLQSIVPLSDDVRLKIAHDPSLLDSFEQLAVSAARPDPMGDAIGEDDTRKSASATTPAERTAQLWNDWGRAIMER